MRFLILMLLAFPFIVLGQDCGIQFQQHLSWRQILEKAKVENKYIFLDFYATWCGPCKAMDRDVYPSGKVGVFMNSNFVSVRVQIDSSVNDNSDIREFYSDAKMLLNTYHISAFPTYLFFDSSGKLVHKGLGY